MANQENPDTSGGEDGPKKKSKMPLIIGLILVVLGGGGGFAAVSSGLILGHSEPEEESGAPQKQVKVSFVEVDPILVSLSPQSAHQYLRFRTQLEVADGAENAVTDLLPRVVDVLNGYLRAVDVAELEKPAALIGLRAQMLRRVQVVVGPDMVNDLLIMEFVLN